ncbi:MAG: glycoside hydrolase, partial [Actinomycetota bacterium]|nr:glycoside hydrolase [Actinomycetota bacterium]
LDASFNALLVAAEEDLGDLWEEIGQKGGEARARAEGMRAALGAQWDPEAGLFRDRDLHGNDGTQETVAGLIPLYAGVPQPHQAARTARAMWDPARFGPSSAFPWAVTSVSKASPYFDPQRYWCGPVWVHVNWLLIRGLQRYRMEAEAEELRRLTLELVERSGFSEYYHPGTRAPLGSGSFCWSASLTIDLLMRPR